MGFFSKLFQKKSKPTETQKMDTCSKCGRKGEPLRKGAKIMVGTVDALKGRIMQCSKCSKLFCGGCGAVSNQQGQTLYKCPNCQVPLQPI